MYLLVASFLSELPAQLVTEVLSGGTGWTVEPEPEGLPRPVEGEVELVLHERTDDPPGLRGLTRASPDDPTDDPLDEVNRVGRENTEDQTHEKWLGHPLVHLLGEFSRFLDRLERPPEQVVREERGEDQPEPVLEGAGIARGDGHVEGRPEADELPEESYESLQLTLEDAPEQVAEGVADQAGDDEGDGPGRRDVLEVALHGGSSE